jgi:GxxExxY protein
MMRHSIPGVPSDRESDETAALVVEACEEVHRRIGPGLALAAYVEALGHELAHRGVPFQRSVTIPVVYRGVRLEAAHRLDLCVRGQVAVDVLAEDAVLPVHRAGLRAKLRVSGLPGGVLVNFRTARFGEGVVIIRRTTPTGRDRLSAQLALLDADTREARAPVARTRERSEPAEGGGGKASEASPRSGGGAVAKRAAGARPPW